MAEKDAEGEIKKLLSPITAQNPKALVSRTYFRAAEAKMCWMPVGIEQPVPADESLSESIDFHNDFTPLGEALKAAILHALKGGGQADIFLISDEEQT